MVFFFANFQQWNNTFFMRTPSIYGGVEKLLVSPNEMWAPDIVLHNKYVIPCRVKAFTCMLGVSTYNWSIEQFLIVGR